MSSNSRIMRSKGESDGLSLPARTRQRKQSTNMENDGNTSLKTTFDTGLDQQHPQMPVHTSPLPTQPLRPTSTQSITGPIAGDRQPPRAIPVADNSGNRCQSTPPQADAVRMQETPVPTVPPTPQRPLTPCILLPKSQHSGSYLSQMSAPLFTEDRYSSSSKDDLAVCNAEITQINRQNEPSQAFTPNLTRRPTSTHSTMDYTTQGDPNQVASSTHINTPVQAKTQNQFLGTNNFFILDGTNRCIHEVQDKVFHAGYLENGNNAYLLELPKLEEMLHTSRFLMDEISGQFYAIYGNTYQCMSTKPMLEQMWGTGELIDQLAAVRQAFGYAGLSGPMPLFNQSPPAAPTTSHNQDDILSKKPAPKTIQYQPPSFNLGRPTTHLTMEERIQVHHNYISAVSNLKHKKDLINRLKRSDLHNILAYEAEMTCHMTLHEDVFGRILTIKKQDNYYRTLEELPVNSLTTYEDIKLFPKLYDTITIIERVTSEADLIKRQLRQPGMYPLPRTPLPSTSGFVPKPSSTFQPVTSTAPQEAANTHKTNRQQSAETSPESSLPCGQWTLIASASVTSTPSQHTPPQPVVPPQPAIPPSPSPNNIHLHTQHQNTPQVSPTTQPKPQSPLRTNTNLPTQPFIPAAETHKSVSNSPQQHVPKSVNGEGVKSSKQQNKSSAPDGRLCYHCKQPGHLKKDCPEQPYCSKCRTRGHIPAKCPTKQQIDESTCDRCKF